MRPFLLQLGSAVALVSVAFATSSSAADVPSRLTSSGGAEDSTANSEVETEDLFGFTAGTDVAEVGKVGSSSELSAVLGKRSGRYRVGTSKSAIGFAPREGFSLEFGLSSTRAVIKNVPGLDNKNVSGISGLSSEIKWQAIKRGEQGPWGLTLIGEPSLAFMDEETGERGGGAAFESRIAIDTALVPDRLFGAANLIYEGSVFRARGAETERSSQAGLSTGLSWRLGDGFFVGAEARYLRAYEGLGLNAFQGHALFLGPTFFAQLSDRASVSGAWSTQVAGRARGTPERLDLENFTRHEAKIKVSLDF